MKLQEIDTERIDWTLTPRTAFPYDGMAITTQEGLDRVQKALEERAGKCYFFVDVWNCEVCLRIAFLTEGGSNIYKVDCDIPEEMLLHAVEAHGGAINMSGHYPASIEVLNWLRQRLL